MSVQPLFPEFSTRPTPIRAIGSLLIAPNGVPRRMLAVCQDAFLDAAACLAESREHDARHDAHLVNAERLALVGLKTLPTSRTEYAMRQQAILREIKAAQAADALEDDAVVRAWTTVKRLAGAIGRLFVMRKRGAKR
jgi:hypothetical protein